MDQDFAIISLGDTGHLTMVQTTTHLNEFQSQSEKLSAGTTFTVTVKEPSCEELGGLPLVARESMKSTKAKCKSNVKSVSNVTNVTDVSVVDDPVPKGPKHAYRVGDTVSGKVKSVRPTTVLVSLENGVVGVIHASEIKDTVTPGTLPTASLKVGSTVTARVIGGKEARSHK